jgi:hypothetical protein
MALTASALAGFLPRHQIQSQLAKETAKQNRQ